MKQMYGKLTISVKEFDEYNKVIKFSTFSVANVSIECVDDIVAEYESMMHSVCGFSNYSITRTFTF